MIRELQLPFVLELLTALGEGANGFVLAGAQAMKFLLPRARATRDFDFVLDAVLVGEQLPDLAETLEQLGYEVVRTARNFQFQKPIRDSSEIMRIEFMAPEEAKRANDFRVDVTKGVHARACTGGSVVILESEVHEISGLLPDGAEVRASLRVARAHSLVMMKCLAMEDRYRNVRGPTQAEHDRAEARSHAADIVAIVTAQTDIPAFRAAFQRQFRSDPSLGKRVHGICGEYFGNDTAPGLLLYEEVLTESQSDETVVHRAEITSELKRAQTMLSRLIEE